MGINQNKQAEISERSPWPYVAPFVVYQIIAYRTPELTPESIDDSSVYNYLVLVIVQVVALLVLSVWLLRVYLADFPFRIDIWGIIVGIVGFGLWIGLCWLNVERSLLGLFGLGDWFQRVGFNPFEQMTEPARRSIFLAFRFVLLAALVPIVEELFLRGWLVRYFDDGHQVPWHQIQLKDIGWTGVAAVALYGLVTHPGEALAAIAWFSLVTWLMIKTGKFWNCVLAHAITNLLLGLYVIWFGQWHLW